MYQSREDQDHVFAMGGGAAASAAALAHDQILTAGKAVPRKKTPGAQKPHIQKLRLDLPALRDNWSERLCRIDLAPDLGADIGSRRWFRGLGTMVGLSAIALALWPGFAPLEAAPSVYVNDAVRDEYRSQMVLPLALGADSGRHMGATNAVRPLAAAPERPQIQMLATLASGDGFTRMLQRAGVGAADASAVAGLVGNVVPLGDIASGTQVDITLGRRISPDLPRPLEQITFRARFDLELTVSRMADGAPLSLTRTPIRVDDTPLRIRGTVGSSLYRSARAAGAPASAVQAYLKALNDQMVLERDVRATDTFDIIVSHRRAATGERQAGQLLYAGIDRGGKPRTQLMRWGKEGRFYEASGVGEQRAGLLAPVPGQTTSRFGMRRHPVLGYRRMHSGLDYKASYGTPIVAVTDGRVTAAGRMGGCGIAVRMRHGGGIDTRYCHMSRMTVNAGQNVRRGQVIGYVGSTGLSTGPHLHYEMYRGGRAVDPASVQYVTRAMLSGAELAQFKSSLAQLKSVQTGAALGDLAPIANEVMSEEPHREIDRLMLSAKHK